MLILLSLCTPVLTLVLDAVLNEISFALIKNLTTQMITHLNNLLRENEISELPVLVLKTTVTSKVTNSQQQLN